MRLTPLRTARWVLAGSTLLSTSLCALAVDIQGVLPAAADQPQIHVLLTTTPGGTPLEGQDEFGDPSYDIQGYLDTGTSGVSIAQDVVADTFNIPNDTYNSQTITFSDVGVGGSQDFYVSPAYYLSLAAFNTDNNIEFGGTPPDPSQYTSQSGPLRMQIDPTPTDPDLGPLNIFGMPTMQNKVMVMDMRPINTDLDNISTYLYDKATPFKPDTLDTDPGIIPSQYHVKLSYGDFSRFTQVTPMGAPIPEQDSNPFIGPNPLEKLPDGPSGAGDTTPPISLSFNSYTSTGSFLFDTGAAASFISQAEANALHVYYAPGTYNTDNPELVDGEGNLIPNQFVVPLGGIGGTINAAGFYLDSMTLQTEEGEPINFVEAPVLVADVSVEDPNNGEMLTLDGDFGMNFLTASVDLDTFDINEGAFDWVTFDQADGTLGLTLAGTPLALPEPTSATALLVAVPMLLRRRRAHLA